MSIVIMIKGGGGKPRNIKTLDAEVIGNIREKLPMSILSINQESNYV